eukprot:g77606.t1
MDYGLLSNNRKIALGMTGFGILFLFLGVLFFFDRPLLALGNVLFLAGTTLLIGPSKTLRFFASKTKIRGTVCLFTGVALVFVGWVIVGMVIEVFGIFNLFGNFFPIIVASLRRMPVVGNILNLPYISTAVDKVAGQLNLLPLSSYDRSH